MWLCKETLRSIWIWKRFSLKVWRFYLVKYTAKEISIFLLLGAELVDTILGVYDKLPEDFTVFVSGTTRKSLPDRILSFDFLMTRSLPVPVCKVAREKVTLLSPLCYIYTSGTTGYLHVKTSN